MAGTGLVAGEVVVDALPYFDQGYEAPGVREAAAALVEEETRRYRPTKNYLSYLTAPDYSAFEAPLHMKYVCACALNPEKTWEKGSAPL
uniref:Pre-mRNA-splicing factor SPF27 n=1 Tax=Sus scrofa TaxID=9823 RepID=A0A8D1QBG6_PIG